MMPSFPAPMAFGVPHFPPPMHVFLQPGLAPGHAPEARERREALPWRELRRLHSHLSAPWRSPFQLFSSRFSFDFN